VARLTALEMSMTTENSILVTGGAGYIGSHTCKRLAESGYTPITFDNLSYGHRHAVKWGPLEVGDLTDAGRLDAVMKQYKPQAVIHFAAYSLVGESVRDPGKYYGNNVGGTLSLLNAMNANGVDKIVFSSTCATYGIPSEVPIRETTPQRPVNPYGHSKLAVEQMLADFDTAHDLRHVALRYFNACGADRDGEIGEEHEPETHLIPRILQSMTGHGPGFAIFGEDYPTPDGTCIRDYIHVEDLAQGHLLALRYLMDGGQSEQLNLGTGHGYSVRQIVDAVETVTGQKVDYDIGPRRAGDPPELTADTSKAKQVLGFETRVSDIETIVANAWTFHQSVINRN
jgi:UDP-arabinose 4-epimerase